jgi:hypothetical protein
MARWALGVGVMSTMTTTLQANERGNLFPCYNGELLSWSPGLYFTHGEAPDYPRARYVLAAMREHRPEQYEQERKLAVKHSLTERVFVAAREYVKLFDVA